MNHIAQYKSKLSEDENWIHDAYQLLTQKYLPHPTEEEILLLEKLFNQWSGSNNQTTLNHLFEIIESHESQKIKNLAILSIKDNFPRERIKVFVDMWITHPLPDLHDLIYELIESQSLSNPLLSVIYLMLDKYDELHKIDPDLINLDNYMNTLDPLLGSLVFRRYSILTRSIISSTNTRELSIIDLIRLQDYNKLWANLLNYPIPFICELIKLLHEEKWIPMDPSDKLIYDHLKELLGTRGWDDVSEVLTLLVSKENDDNIFKPLKKSEIRDKEFHMMLSPDLINRPDRIANHDFIHRGNRNLTDTDMGVHMYMDTIRKSNVDGMLHIPFYTGSGVELAEFTIPVSNTNSFSMDNDGLYFIVKNKSGIYSVDIDAIAALLLPVNKHSTGVSEIVSTMLENATGKSKLLLKGLYLLSTFHRGREYTLFDNKDSAEIEPSKLELSHCLCTLSIDIGNTSTKLYLLPGRSCGHESDYWEYPSIIYYRAPNDFIIGDDVLEKNLLNSSQTLSHFKNKLSKDIRTSILIHSSSVTVHDAYLDYLTSIIKKVTDEVDFEIPSLAVTFTSNMPSGFDIWLNKELSKLNFSRILIVEEINAMVIKRYRMDNTRGNTLLLNFGSSHSSASVASFPLPKSRKRIEQSRIVEFPLVAPTIIAKITIPLGVSDIYDELSSLSKHSLNDLDEKLKDLYNGFEQNFTEDQLNNIVLNSEYYNQLQYLIRNIIVKSNYRGINKDEIETIVLSGKFARNKVVQEYIHSVFPDMEIIIDENNYGINIGSGLISQGQTFKTYLNRDYFLKISNRGVVNFTKILSRGELVGNFRKSFEIRPKAWFDKIVIDLWNRLPNFANDENELPLKDDDHPIYRKDSSAKKFSTTFLLRELLPFDKEGNLIINISAIGDLSFSIMCDDDLSSLNTRIMVL